MPCLGRTFSYGSEGPTAKRSIKTCLEAVDDAMAHVHLAPPEPVSGRAGRQVGVVSEQCHSPVPVTYQSKSSGGVVSPNQFFWSRARASSAACASPFASAAFMSPTAAQPLFGERLSAARKAASASSGFP